MLYYNIIVYMHVTTFLHVTTFYLTLYCMYVVKHVSISIPPQYVTVWYTVIYMNCHDIIIYHGIITYGRPLCTDTCRLSTLSHMTTGHVTSLLVVYMQRLTVIFIFVLALRSRLLQTSFKVMPNATWSTNDTKVCSSNTWISKINNIILKQS